MVVLKYISKTLCVWKFGWTDGWLADAKEWWTVDISASINLNEKIMQTEILCYGQVRILFWWHSPHESRLADAKEWWTVDISTSINLNENIMLTEILCYGQA